jgi:hypothetical protein
MSTASTTKFCGAWLDLNRDCLFLDGNSKIDCNGTYWEPRPNSLSLLPVTDCPGSTGTCRRECYVHGLREAQPNLYDHYQENSETLRRILGDQNLGAEWAAALGTWINQNARRGFRWHVSGDVISRTHAWWIEAVCVASPSVRHWIYTRSLWAVPILTQAPNLVVNVSADEDNVDLAAPIAAEYDLRLCYLATEDPATSLPIVLPDRSVIFPSYELRGRELDQPTDHWWWKGLSKRERKMVCPVDFFGKSRTIRCAVCKRCMRHPHERRGA